MLSRISDRWLLQQFWHVGIDPHSSTSAAQAVVSDFPRLLPLTSRTQALAPSLQPLLQGWEIDICLMVAEACLS